MEENKMKYYYNEACPISEDRTSLIMEENKMKYYYKVYGLNIESEIKIQELVILNDEDKANIDVTIYIDNMPKSINTAKNQEILEGFRKK